LKKRGPDNGKEESLAELCADAGWPFCERDINSGRVELETGDDFRQALVERRKGKIRTWVELARAESFEGECRHALAVLLLRSAAAVRFARAATRKESDGLAAGFEVLLDAQPSPTDLNHALASLSVACRVCAREAAELEDPELASSYLHLQCGSELDNTGRRGPTSRAKQED
jgi:hypothetical protein